MTCHLQIIQVHCLDFLNNINTVRQILIHLEGPERELTGRQSRWFLFQIHSLYSPEKIKSVISCDNISCFSFWFYFHSDAHNISTDIMNSRKIASVIRRQVIEDCSVKYALRLPLTENRFWLLASTTFHKPQFIYL